MVELHLPGGPVLLDEVAAAFAPEARLATPGEFTRRAFTNGRLDLAEAEAVLGLIHAADLEAEYILRLHWPIAESSANFDSNYSQLLLGYSSIFAGAWPVVPHALASLKLL